MASGDDRPVVIFGNLRSASLAWYCLMHDSAFKVAGFTVDEAYIASLSFEACRLCPSNAWKATIHPVITAC
jgi:hypothetical protein